MDGPAARLWWLHAGVHAGAVELRVRVARAEQTLADLGADHPLSATMAESVAQWREYLAAAEAVANELAAAYVAKARAEGAGAHA